jgi:hypothetical protein
MLATTWHRSKDDPWPSWQGNGGGGARRRSTSRPSASSTSTTPSPRITAGPAPESASTCATLSRSSARDGPQRRLSGRRGLQAVRGSRPAALPTRGGSVWGVRLLPAPAGGGCPSGCTMAVLVNTEGRRAPEGARLGRPPRGVYVPPGGAGYGRRRRELRALRRLRRAGATRRRRPLPQVCPGGGDESGGARLVRPRRGALPRGQHRRDPVAARADPGGQRDRGGAEPISWSGAASPTAASSGTSPRASWTTRS